MTSGTPSRVGSDTRVGGRCDRRSSESGTTAAAATGVPAIECARTASTAAVVAAASTTTGVLREAADANLAASALSRTPIRTGPGRMFTRPGCAAAATLAGATRPATFPVAAGGVRVVGPIHPRLRRVSGGTTGTSGAARWGITHAAAAAAGSDQQPRCQRRSLAWAGATARGRAHVRRAAAAAARIPRQRGSATAAIKSAGEPWLLPPTST